MDVDILECLAAWIDDRTDMEAGVRIAAYVDPGEVCNEADHWVPRLVIEMRDRATGATRVYQVEEV
jgi:hypothetical protein